MSNGMYFVGWFVGRPCFDVGVCRNMAVGECHIINPTEIYKELGSSQIMLYDMSFFSYSKPSYVHTYIVFTSVFGV